VLQLDKHDDADGVDAGSAPAAFSIMPDSMVLLAQGWSQSLHTLDLYNITPAEMPEAVRSRSAFRVCLLLGVTTQPRGREGIHCACALVWRNSWLAAGLQHDA
jgi:hypothetical protein